MVFRELFGSFLISISVTIAAANFIDRTRLSDAKTVAKATKSSSDSRRKFFGPLALDSTARFSSVSWRDVLVVVQRTKEGGERSNGAQFHGQHDNQCSRDASSTRDGWFVPTPVVFQQALRAVVFRPGTPPALADPVILRRLSRI